MKMKLKLFEGINIMVVEETVNKWTKQQKLTVKITDKLMATTPYENSEHKITIAIWYEEL